MIAKSNRNHFAGPVENSISVVLVRFKFYPKANKALNVAWAGRTQARGLLELTDSKGLVTSSTTQNHILVSTLSQSQENIV